ncbi:MAG: vitamin B12 dependent-methionine synthase activation domain-containing protein [Lachnospiraceae bacterium]
MRENTIFVKNYPADEKLFPVNEREIWRYSGYAGLSNTVDEELKKVLSEVMLELKDTFSYKVCYRRISIEWDGDRPGMPWEYDSKNLAQCLKGSSEVIIFAATIGLNLDRHIARCQRFAPTKALLMQAYGAERVEVLCDVFCREIRETVAHEGLTCTPRFSPGYGDLPLKAQMDMFRLLDCNRRIGISLNESLLMTPSKSVTAIFGLRPLSGTVTCPDASGEKEGTDKQAGNDGSAGHQCQNCSKTNCEFRIL